MPAGAAGRVEPGCNVLESPQSSLLLAGGGTDAVSSPARSGGGGGPAGVNAAGEVAREGGGSGGGKVEQKGDKTDLYMVLQAREQREREEREQREKEEEDAREREEASWRERESAPEERGGRASDSVAAADAHGTGGHAGGAAQAGMGGMGAALDLADRTGAARGGGRMVQARAVSPDLGMGGRGGEPTRMAPGVEQRTGGGMPAGVLGPEKSPAEERGEEREEERDSSEEDEEDPYGTVALDVGGMRRLGWVVWGVRWR